MEMKINVEGMTCGHCKMSVEKALNGLAGVESAVVSLEAKNVVVKYDDTKVDFEKMKEAIEDQGYDVVE